MSVYRETAETRLTDIFPAYDWENSLHLDFRSGTLTFTPIDASTVVVTYDSMYELPSVLHSYILWAIAYYAPLKTVRTKYSYYPGMTEITFERPPEHAHV